MTATPAGGAGTREVFYVAAGRASGAVLILPGGAYTHHAAHEGQGYARWLTTLGLDAVVLNYSTGEHAWPAALGDARAALRRLRDRTPADLPVGVIGSSAGGHLAAAVCTAIEPAVGGGGARPQFAVLSYPVVSFETAPHDVSSLHVLGPSPTPEARAAVSVNRWVDSDTPPTFVWTTAEDEAVPALHTLLYLEALTHAGVPVEAHIFPHGPHGLGLAPDHPSVARWTGLCEAWLREQGVIRTPV